MLKKPYSTKNDLHVKVDAPVEPVELEPNRAVSTRDIISLHSGEACGFDER